MTAIEAAKAHFNYGVKCDIFSEPVRSYAKTAISALEKQIPKKPILYNTYSFCFRLPSRDWKGKYAQYKCPNCNEGTSKEYKYCNECGQALDWSDAE